ncbi:hypothetical protein [Micromonospora coerulea]|uniref:hypothetical protein n=1 Tax=Micromonospora coerulea TaxID=47856 RepID=UPI00190750D8|nr:hypothetical protein [Micromonospora veneta]
MGLVVELRDRAGNVIGHLPDPSGGTFDAAGDFDRTLNAGLDLPVLSSIDTFADTTMPSAAMRPLLQDIDTAMTAAKDGPKLRGLMRLRVLAENCLAHEGSVLVFMGD